MEKSEAIKQSQYEMSNCLIGKPYAVWLEPVI